MPDTVTEKIRRARAYVADIRAGHISWADEGVPFMTLTGYADDLLAIIDQQAKTLPARYESVLGQALRDAIKWCDYRAAESCADCDATADGLCPLHADFTEQASFYRAVARQLGIEVDR